MAPVKHPRRTARTQAESEGYFAVFYAMGPERTLERLARESVGFGLKRKHLSTIKVWSSQYQWQNRIRTLDEQTSRASMSDHIREVQDMNRTHAVIGSMGVQAAARGLEQLIRHIGTEKPCEHCGLAPLKLDANEISRLMDTFATWQRKALGEATDRTEITITIWNLLTIEVVQAYLATEVYEDPERRKREFMLEYDAIKMRHFGAVLEGAV